PQEPRDLAGIDAVVLGLAAVDGLHVQGMAEHEGDFVILAQIGQPVPGEHALAADDQALAKWLDGVEKGCGPGRQIAFVDGLALLVEDVGEHASCVQIDAAIECVLGVVKAHGYESSFAVMGRAEPASWLSEARVASERSTLDPASAESPLYH